MIILLGGAKEVGCECFVNEIEFDEDRYIERLEKLLTELEISKNEVRDSTLIMDEMEKEIVRYFEYRRKSRSF
jgi:hypothetical protein